jgi:osmotically-inducible protein OsmY
VADKSLSTYAHNVKIIADHGKVTLKGPVHTEEEKKKIEAIAADVVGPGNVTNEIEVKGDKK